MQSYTMGMSYMKWFKSFTLTIIYRMSGTTISSFNELMTQFLDDLEVAFPKDTSIKRFQATFGLLKKTNARKPLTEFMESIAPYASHVMARDDSFFLQNDVDIEFVKSLNIKELWAQATPENKDAIWQYLQTLYIIGMTITSLPPETLSVIENVAKQCAESLKGTEFMELLGKNPMKM